ncbi:MAG: phosphotransferase, partial [Planctomycetaceae bacterium]
DTVVSNAAEFLAQLHLKSPYLKVLLEDLVHPVRHDVLSLATNATQRDTVNRVADRILETFADTFHGAVWAHGDSKVANYMFDPKTGELTGVIDWGTGFQPELPGYDLSFLVVSSEASRTRTGVPDQLLKQYRSGPPQQVCEHLTWFAAKTDLPLDDSQYRALIGYQWMKRLAPLATEYETMRFNHHYIDRMFDAVAE